MSRKVSERFYSKIEVQALRSLFKALTDAIKEQPKADPNVLMANIQQYDRQFMRQFMGIQRILFTQKEDHTLVIVGLEGRTQNYTMKVTFGAQGGVIEGEEEGQE